MMLLVMLLWSGRYRSATARWPDATLANVVERGLLSELLLLVRVHLLTNDLEL